MGYGLGARARAAPCPHVPLAAAASSGSARLLADQTPSSGLPEFLMLLPLECSPLARCLPCCSDADGSRADPTASACHPPPSASIRINYSDLTTSSPLPNPNNTIA
jgi:hypothetical protein